MINRFFSRLGIASSGMIKKHSATLRTAPASTPDYQDTTRQFNSLRQNNTYKEILATMNRREISLQDTGFTEVSYEQLSRMLESEQESARLSVY